MDFERLTEKSKSALQAAQTLAMRSDHQSLEPEHLLRAMLDDEDGLIKKLIKATDGSVSSLQTSLDEALARLPSVSGPGAGQLRISSDLAKIIDNALKMAEKSGDKFITLERIFQAMILVLL